MKFKFVLPIILSILLYSCSGSSNSPEFTKKTKGKYLFNSDEIVEVYFKENQLYMNWRGADKIKPMKINDDTFFVKEMNKKIQFLTNPSDNVQYIGVVPKEKNLPTTYDYRKLLEGEKIPGEYLENNEFDKAIIGYLAIKERDSLDPSINERDFNSLGYRALRDKNPEKAIGIFEINVVLHPTSYNVYDSLADAFLDQGDTLKAIINYKKALELNSGSKRLKRVISKLEKKE